MIDGAFCLAPGIGPSREKELWKQGITCWREFPATGTVLAPTLDERIRLAIARMQQLIAEQRWSEVVKSLPKRDRWRLFPHVEPEARYLDIETTGDGRITVIGVYDQQGGPRLYVRGHNLARFLNEPPAAALVTFNGLAFDVPVIRRAFPQWRPPAVHIDLRDVCSLLGERGGLKAIEERLGIGRPAHLKGVNGLQAVRDWEAFRRWGDAKALHRLLEYNLYDVVQLRSLAEIACEKLAQRCGRVWVPRHRFFRGDVLYDITRAVMSVTEHAARIDPEAYEERAPDMFDEPTSAARPVERDPTS